ncbi:histidine phosphatase family protein [Streptomyces zagrosensis]|uniref:Putative phosphoglycerate mutase n=1 Tax=Streptomyces zagrosensis TaxID=1042984 RepID=A0A7W9Q5F6_9ACTN|nr:histidine phosphatase family protein [Streptomyces zagrosensis]MBB5933147.1 putative phosphoglycerate mutase [Streptomyces zagrosensis]
MAELLLVRHGETEWSRSGQHTSWTDLPLTERGVAQAQALRPLLAARTIGLVLVSPRERAKETARLVGLLDRAEVEPDLREWEYGGYEGITTPDIQRTRPHWSLWTDGAPAGDSPEHPGESPDEVGARADRVLARLAPLLDESNGPGSLAGESAGVGAVSGAGERRNGGAQGDVGDGPASGVAGDVVLVGHGHFLRVLAARRLGLPAAAGALFRLDTATVSRIGLEHGRPAVTGWNLPAS